METLQGLNLTVLVGYLKKSNLDKTLGEFLLRFDGSLEVSPD
jgi:hypothetical protein